MLATCPIKTISSFQALTSICYYDDAKKINQDFIPPKQNKLNSSGTFYLQILQTVAKTKIKARSGNICHCNPTSQGQTAGFKKVLKEATKNNEQKK